jgi:autotransporter adhesin
VTASNGLAIGRNAQANGYDGGIAVGSGATVSATGFYGGMAIGAGALASAGTAIGYSSSATNQGTVALGREASVNSPFGSALGAFSTTTGSNSVALGANSQATRANVVSVGVRGSERQIVNVAAGTQGTDAVNFAQLQSAGLKVDSSGTATNALVAYDNTTEGKVTLGDARERGGGRGVGLEHGRSQRLATLRDQSERRDQCRGDCAKHQRYLDQHRQHRPKHE